ncbi:MAG: ATP-binding protein [Candidatus Rokubacteria bacterium]|nr:ATP-binding protein [Candidatus Rokubacteria bacterium]
MGETRVDLLHLLEDLRDAYPGALEETILTEIVANSLDSGATRVSFASDPAGATLTVVDNGAGMARRELVRYHDIAATTKTRGQGIGFAGVGIKLGLLACEEVFTETRRGKTHVASTWHLASRQRAPWRRIPPPGLVAEHGTAVRLRLRNPLSPLLDGGFLAACIERHFEPLLDSAFDACLAPHYPGGVRFAVNERELPRQTPGAGRAPLAIRVGRKRKPTAVGYLIRTGDPLPEAERGVAISTLGKIIKRGWDWLGLSPAAPDRVSGLIEVPGLAGCLTLNKADFIRTGPRGATYLAYRKAIQEAVSAQFAVWGDTRDRTEEARRRARPVERELQTVLVDLAEEFPLLATLVERQAGGQGRLPMGRPGQQLEVVPVPSGALVLGAPEEPAAAEGATPEPVAAPAEERGPREPEPPAPPEPERPKPAAPLPGGPAMPGERGPRRPGRYTLAIRFESRPEDLELGRLVESTVWVNAAHPAYRRAVASRSDGYHIALTVAMALAPLAVEPQQAQGFVTAFLARWGGVLDRAEGGRRPGRRPRR